MSVYVNISFRILLSFVITRIIIKRCVPQETEKLKASENTFDVNDWLTCFILLFLAYLAIISE